MSGKRIGYIRVSTEDQNPERQLDGIQLDKKFIEYASARSMDRYQLKMMQEYVREDDVVIVHSMDRLARNVRDLRKIVDDLVSRKIEVHFLKENLVFKGNDNPMSNFSLSILGAVAELEWSILHERQKEGIELAKKAGKYKGRKRKLDATKIEILKEEMKTRKTKSQIAFDLGISRNRLYWYLKELNINEVKEISLA